MSVRQIDHQTLENEEREAVDAKVAKFYSHEVHKEVSNNIDQEIKMGADHAS